MQDGLWLSVSELAARRGLHKTSVSERVANFEAKGLLTTRHGKGRSKLVNVAEFDRAAGIATDITRQLNGGGSLQPPAPAPDAEPKDPTASETLTRENARRAAYTADLAHLELQERLGKVVRREDVMDATCAVGDVMVRLIDELPSHHAEIAEAVGQDGAAGARALLKRIAFDLREKVAAELSALAAPKGSEAA
jgi:DNA-binding MarR family transcriptional regulator